MSLAYTSTPVDEEIFLFSDDGTIQQEQAALLTDLEVFN